MTPNFNPIILLHVLYLLFAINTVSAQNSSVRPNKYSNPAERNYINVGLDKVVDTYFFRGRGVYNVDLLYGTLRLNQNYYGTVIRNRKPLNDFETFNLEYEYSLSNNILLSFEQNWLLTSYNNLDELERLNGIAGIKYKRSDKFFVGLGFGLEDNKTLGLLSGGRLLQINSALSNINIDNYIINSKLSARRLELNRDRVESNFAIGSNVFKNFDKDNRLFLDFGYFVFNTNSVYQGLSDINKFSIESRDKDSLMINLGVGFQLLDYFNTNISLSLTDYSLLRSFKEPVINSSWTGVAKNKRQFLMSFFGDIGFDSDYFTQKIGLNFQVYDHENHVTNKFDIPIEEENRLRNIEFQLDENRSTTGLISKSKWKISRRDTLSVDYSVSLSQYNTPSLNNNEDRDEFISIVNISLRHRFSSYLTAIFAGEMYMNHRVYIKSQRSADSRWNRIYRFTPQIIYESKKFRMQPQFEVLADYTIYDFEFISPGINSFSRRQIKYKDQIFIEFLKNISLQSQIFIRYYEIGTMYWDAFAETAQESNFEHFTQMLLVARTSPDVSMGCGARYYKLTKKNLIDIGSGPGLKYDLISIGPEAMIKIQFPSGSRISLSGWYEFQFINKEMVRNVPNLFLQTKMYM